MCIIAQPVFVYVVNTFVSLQMIKRALFFLAILCYCQSLWAAETGPARLLVSKNVLNNIIVQGKDLSIEYKIYNVGER